MSDYPITRLTSDPTGITLIERQAGPDDPAIKWVRWDIAEGATAKLRQEVEQTTKWATEEQEAAIDAEIALARAERIANAAIELNHQLLVRIEGLEGENKILHRREMEADRGWRFFAGTVA